MRAELPVRTRTQAAPQRAVCGERLDERRAERRSIGAGKRLGLRATCGNDFVAFATHAPEQ